MKVRASAFDRTSCRPRGAFTLIELLVVVAIIGLLIAILLPSLSAARRQARQVLCKTNLRTLGQAGHQYAHENRGLVVRAEYRPPPGADPNSALHFSQALLMYLPHDGELAGKISFPALVTAEVTATKPLLDLLRVTPQFQCPDFPPATSPDLEQFLDYVVSAFVVPYTALNVAGDTAGGGQPGESYGAANQVAGFVDFEVFTRLDLVAPAGSSASRITFLAEAHPSLPVNRVVFHDLFYASQLPFGSAPRVASDRRHPGGQNLLFFDGHADTFSVRSIDAGWPNPIGIRLRWFSSYLN